MKKIILSILAIGLFNTVFSQENNDVKPKNPKSKKTFKKEVYIGGSAGISLFGILWKGLKEMDDTISMNYKFFGKSTPVIGVSIDANISKKVTVGLNYALQTLRLDIDYWWYEKYTGVYYLSWKNDAKINRTYFGGKMLYHYINNERADIYSGVRAGIIRWKVKLDDENPDLIPQIKNNLFLLNRPAVALIPVGFRIKFLDKFAVCSEFTLGAPNFISAGLTYQISEQKNKK